MPTAPLRFALLLAAALGAAGAGAQPPVAGTPAGPRPLIDADPRKPAELAGGRWYRWVARTGQKDEAGNPRPLHFAFRLPADFDPATPLSPRTVCVFLPDLGGDHASLAAAVDGIGALRPRDVLVTTDGLSIGPGGSPTFTGDASEAGVLRALLLELPRHFATSRLVLVGHGQGGLFACHFAGDMGRMLDGGVVAVGSGVWNWSRTDAQFRAVPTVLIHAVNDPVRPYFATALARDGLVVSGAGMLAVRRLGGENSFDIAAISTAIDWCLAMRADKPADSLAAVSAMLAGPPGPAPLGLARRALRRFEGQDPPFRPALKPDDPATKQAWDKSVAIEARAQAHVDALRARLNAHADLLKPPIDAADGAWIGHLLAVREDMRGVDAVERLLTDLAFDAAAASHSKEAGRLLLVLESDAPVKDVFAASVEALPKCYLFDGLPPGLADRLRSWRTTPDVHGLTPESIAAFDRAMAVLDARAAGQAAYEELCRK